MCSPASLASRNVKQEIALGWQYRPSVPAVAAGTGRRFPKMSPIGWKPRSGSRFSNAPSPIGWGASPGVGALRNHPPTAGCLFVSDAASGAAILAGREGEQAQLRAQLDRMLAGRGRDVLVGGEAGIGKTTLVEDLSIAGRGARRSRPLGPCVRPERHAALRSLAGDLPPVSGASDAELPPLPAFVVNAEELAAWARRRRSSSTMAELLRRRRDSASAHAGARRPALV